LVGLDAKKQMAYLEALPQSKVTQAIRDFGLDPEKPDPTTV
jgi:hypothetical protein